MKYFVKNLWLLSLVLLSCSSLSLRHPLADDSHAWPQWGRNAQHTGSTTASLDWPLVLKWSYRASAGVMPSILAIDDLVLVTFMDGKQEALRLADAKEMGSIRLRGSVPFTCANVGDKLVLLRSIGSENLMCYDLKSGRIEWRKTIGPALGEPLIVDTSIYIALNIGRLNRYDLNSGREMRSVALKNQSQSTPAYLDDRIVIAGDQGHVEVFNTDLQPLWSFACAGSIRATPVLSANTIFLGTTQGLFYAFDLTLGTLKWQIQTTGNIHRTAAANDSIVVFGCTDHYLYGLAAKTGQELWRFKTSAPISTNPLLCGNAAIVGSMDKTLYAVNLQSGQQIWSFTAKGRWRASPIISQDRLLCSAEDDYLYCFGTP